MTILPLDTFKLLSCPFVYYSVASSQAKIYSKIKSNKKFFICGSSCLRAINMVCKNLKVSFNAGKLNGFSAVCSSDYKEIPCALPASPAPFFCPQTAPETSDVLNQCPCQEGYGGLFPRNSLLPYVRQIPLARLDLLHGIGFLFLGWKKRKNWKKNPISFQAAHWDKGNKNFSVMYSLLGL